MGADIRVLSATAIEDYHAHLVRLDRKSRFPGMDDRAIEVHLRLAQGRMKFERIGLAVIA